MQDILILGYHGVSQSWRAEFSVTPGRFRRQIESVLDRGFRPSTLRDVVAAEECGRQLVVTFDDALRSVVDVALPILEEYECPATVFAVTAFVGSGMPQAWKGVARWAETGYASEMVPLEWDELRNLADRGWEIGSHTCRHPRLTRLDGLDLTRELKESKTVVESEISGSCESFCAPYGAVDAHVVSAARSAGYRFGCTSIPCGPRDMLALPRVGVSHADTELAFRIKTAPVVRRARWRDTWASRRMRWSYAHVRRALSEVA